MKAKLRAVYNELNQLYVEDEGKPSGAEREQVQKTVGNQVTGSYGLGLFNLRSV